MSFATPVFLWYFLPTVLALTWVAPRGMRNSVVAVSSLVFYAVGAGPTTLLLLMCIEVNFLAGMLLHRADAIGRPSQRRSIMIAAVAVDLGALAVWKYAGFATVQLHNLSETTGLGSTRTFALALPIGISFYTFHQISYVVDVYRRVRDPQPHLVAYITYVAMFPQLIAGPIVRYHEIADQLAGRTTGRFDDLVAGFPRFCLGLTKKVVVADSLAPIANVAFSTPTGELSTTAAWLGVAAYTVQLYFDFSGYSDMAIGLGRMLGFQLPENFARPYSAQSITDFWRRWHMSLSRWFRDYLYIPLGGNRGGTVQTYRNLWIVFLLVGLWHGANWTFLVWGAYHGTLLVIERAVGVQAEVRAGVPILRRATTLLLVMIGWVLFRATSLGQAAGVLGRMFWNHGGGLTPDLADALTHQRIVVLVLAGLVVFLPGWLVLGPVLQSGRQRWVPAARFALVTLGAGYAAILVAAGTFSPFLYYQF